MEPISMLSAKRPDWDQYFLDIAEAVAQRSTCIRRKVGALVVYERRIISTGYNGAPSGDPHCSDGHCPRGQVSYDEVPAFSQYADGTGRCIAVHAEVNAIEGLKLLELSEAMQWEIFSKATIYVNAHPCQYCQATLWEHGPMRFVAREAGVVEEIFCR